VKEASLIADLLRDGLPPRHTLVLVESAVADGHPLLESLARRGAVLEAGRLTAAKGGRVSGIDRLVEQLASETGVHLRSEAAGELARRTLRLEDSRRSGGEGSIDADSAARFAAEYRKLAILAGASGVNARAGAGESRTGAGGRRPILDALAEGRPEAALAKIRRRLASAEDPALERLSLFGLLSGFARQLAAVGGALEETGARRAESSYPRFKERLAPELQQAIGNAGLPAVARLHPFRLHRVYLAASRFPAERLGRLPALTLEAERRLKGDSSDPDAALAAYTLALAAPADDRSKVRGARPRLQKPWARRRRGRGTRSFSRRSGNRRACRAGGRAARGLALARATEEVIPGRSLEEDRLRHDVDGSGAAGRLEEQGQALLVVIDPRHERHAVDAHREARFGESLDQAQACRRIGRLWLEAARQRRVGGRHRDMDLDRVAPVELPEEVEVAQSERRRWSAPGRGLGAGQHLQQERVISNCFSAG
jgi:hypothetical protein